MALNEKLLMIKFTFAVLFIPSTFLFFFSSAHTWKMYGDFGLSGDAKSNVFLTTMSADTVDRIIFTFS